MYEPSGKVRGRSVLLAQAIQHLYDAFARYEPSALDRSCACCVSRDDIENLRSRGLRELTANHLSYYSFKAITTIGTVSDWKYFLPRICELIATVPFPKDVETVLAGKLEHANFADWPPHERAAVEQYLHALWDDLLHTWPYHEHADVVLCCITRVLGSPAAALDAWSALLPTQRSARLHLANWLSWGPGCNDRPPPFWEDARPGWAQVVAWSKSEVVASAMESAFAEWAQTSEGAKWYGTERS